MLLSSGFSTVVGRLSGRGEAGLEFCVSCLRVLGLVLFAGQGRFVGVGLEGQGWRSDSGRCHNLPLVSR